MQAEEHEAAAMRIERSLRKCSADDHEIVIEAAMLAGSHWLNARLHRLGTTPPAQDLMHTYLLVVNELRRLSVAAPQAAAALSEIEDLRPAYVRGAHPGGAQAAQRALSLLDVIRGSARPV
ncbi:MAG TPA: hypothetical protein VGE47_02405 [Burkholderiaceae bacterium]